MNKQPILATELDKAIEHIAKHCHEINRLYCLSLGDDSQPAWEDAPTWQQESACHGVVYHLANDDVKPEDSHNSWMKNKLDNGWVLGETKDEAKKTHPQLVPYDELPLEQQIKDKLFGTTVAMYKDYYKVFTQ